MGTKATVAASMLTAAAFLLLWPLSAFAIVDPPGCPGFTHCFNPSIIFNGTNPIPGSTFPYVEVGVVNSGADQVTMTFQSDLEGAGQNFQEIDFNLNPLINPLALQIVFSSGTGDPADAIGLGTDCCQADGDGKFDISFQWTSGIFGATQLLVYTITCDTTIDATGCALFDQNSFNFFSTHQGDADGCAQVPDCSFRIAAHVIGGGTSTWIGGAGVIPEPATLFLLGSGLVGMGLAGRRKWLSRLVK